MVQVVILGSSYGGLFSAVNLSKVPGLEITVISMSDIFYLNPASPRVLIEPEKTDLLFLSVPEIIKKHTTGSFIHGKVTKVNPDSNSVEYQLVESGEPKTILYDHLVISTGTNGEPALQISESGKQTREAFEKLVKDVKEKESIAILGGNATGIELVAEIKSAYPHKNVTLYNKFSRLLFNFDEVLGVKVEPKLKVLGINIVHNKTFTKQDGKKIFFHDGTTAEADVIVKTWHTPNSGFLDDKYKNEIGYLKVDDYMRLIGTENVWVLGDILAKGNRSIPDIRIRQVPLLKTNISNSVNGKSLKKYNVVAILVIIPVARTGGVGQLFGYNLPNFLVWFIKGRDYMLGRARNDFI